MEYRKLILSKLDIRKFHSSSIGSVDLPESVEGVKCGLIYNLNL
jgi:hypothetical protein